MNKKLIFIGSFCAVYNAYGMENTGNSSENLRKEIEALFGVLGSCVALADDVLTNNDPARLLKVPNSYLGEKSKELGSVISALDPAHLTKKDLTLLTEGYRSIQDLAFLTIDQEDNLNSINNAKLLAIKSEQAKFKPVRAWVSHLFKSPFLYTAVGLGITAGAIKAGYIKSDMITQEPVLTIVSCAAGLTALGAMTHAASATRKQQRVLGDFIHNMESFKKYYYKTIDSAVFYKQLR